MKKFKYLLILVMSVAFVVSCTDDSLDPLQFKKVQKGTELALRGQQLQNLYNIGIPGAEIFPKILTGNEKFNYDAEYLASDKSSLASMDIYVYKVPFTVDAVTGVYKANGAAVRTPVMNVPFSAFKSDGTYLGPWVSVSITLPQILTLLGLPAASDPSYKTSGSTNPLLTIYKLGINMDTDLNLVSGSKILAADIVAAGLFQSNQFYPAMKLTWTVTDYCAYDKTTWANTYVANEFYATSSYGPYNVTWSVDPADATGNTFKQSNFWDCGFPGPPPTVKFSTSTNPSTQVVNYPSQDDGFGGTIVSTGGSYNQCLGSFKANVTWTWKAASALASCTGGTAGTSSWRYEFTLP